MLPTLPVDHFALIDIGFPYTRLEVGDIVIFWDYRRGGYTLHRLVAKQGAFFIARGDNPETNKTADRAFVIPENYIGKFVGKY